MKNIFTIVCIALIASTFTFAQKKSTKAKPFIIQGQLLNCTATKASIFFTDKNGERVKETADIDEQGKFKLVSTKLIKPTTVSLQSNDFNFTIYAAPGYDLNLTADCKFKYDIINNKRIEGYGATATKYLFMFEQKTPKGAEWFELNGNKLLVHLKARKNLCDSIYKVVLSKTAPPDEFLEYYRKRIRWDIDFFNLDAITYQAGKDNTLNYTQTLNFVNANTDQALLKNLYKPEYLISDAYRTFMLDGYYSYLWNLKIKQDPNTDKKRYYVDCAKIISTNYKGEIKFMTLNKVLKNSITYARSFEELNQYKKHFPPYIAQLNKSSNKKAIEKLLGDKEKELFKTQIGKPAPAFTATDISGKSFDLADFKGKVVMLDLWASWCGPCREMTPYLKNLFAKYNPGANLAFVNVGANPNLAFISVAVNDETEKWKRAMDVDKPTWLQLFDNKNIVQNSYVANSIPKLIVIDKKGNIVTLDAPMSQSMDELKKILDTELSK